MSNPHNRLGLEQSPYLKQHQTNPVNWFAWGEEAFRAAKEQDKPIFLSIGYSTCYWCHVMEKDSFELEEVAKLLNQDFICIKVDREERPDVDQIYMQAVIGISGHGGWPMSVFLTPTLEPFWGGTFFYRAQFMQILEALARAWREDRESVLGSASKISQILKEREVLPDANQPSQAVLEKASKQFEMSFDKLHAGFGSAPKFPPACQVSFLLGQAKLHKTPQLAEMGLSTLRQMARGGIFDQVGGGFHRYATDRAWLVPHFEKMLYDNALLASAYLQAFQYSADAFFRKIAERTLDYLLSEMSHAQGGFYAAQDAGEVGKEGEFYVWGYVELQSLLSAADFEELSSVFDLSAEGNFENAQNILALKSAQPDTIIQSEKLQNILNILLHKRKERVAPALDNKILTGWNGLAISAFAQAYKVTGKERYLNAAKNTANFIRNNLYRDGELLRSFCQGQASIQACLEDYAYLIEGLINLQQATFEKVWLDFALELQALQDQKLWDDAEKSYFYSEASELFYDKKDLLDGATPSANSTSINNLLLLDRMRPGRDFASKALQMLKTLAPLFEHYPSALCKGLMALQYSMSGGVELKINTSNSAQELKAELQQIWQLYLPDLVINLSSKLPNQSEATLYVLCKEGSCSPPYARFESFYADLKS